MNSIQHILISCILFAYVPACNSFVISQQQSASSSSSSSSASLQSIISSHHATATTTTTTTLSVSSITSPKDIVISTTDDDARSQFGTKDYWDELYQGRGDFPAEEYSWYFGWEGYGKLVKEHVVSKDCEILIPGIGNDGILLDLLRNGYNRLTATDYSEHAIERQKDLVSYEYSEDAVELMPMDARQMDEDWTGRFDAVLEKGAFDAIYLSGDGNLEQSVKEIERVLKPGGVLLSVSGVVPDELRKEVFREWEWVRDGSHELKAGCFVLKRPAKR